jgi:hypothetical protein
MSPLVVLDENNRLIEMRVDVAHLHFNRHTLVLRFPMACRHQQIKTAQ